MPRGIPGSGPRSKVKGRKTTGARAGVKRKGVTAKKKTTARKKAAGE